MKQPVKYRLPTEPMPQNGQPYINVGSSAFLSAVFLISIFTFWFLVFAVLSFYIFWRDLPGLLKPPGQQTITLHMINYFTYALGHGLHIKVGMYELYVKYLQYLIKHDSEQLVFIRWNIATISGFLAGLYFSIKSSYGKGYIRTIWRPVLNWTQVSGMTLIEGYEAVEKLRWKFAYARFESLGSKFIKKIIRYFDLPILSLYKETFIDYLHSINVKTESEYKEQLIFSNIQQKNLYNPKIKYQDEDFIYMPSDLRKKHFLIVGATGAGKGVIISQMVQQIRERIEDGQNYFAFIYDTPKNEYSRQFPDSMCYIIGPQDKGTMPHAIQRDLILKQHAVQFWASRIPENEKDPFWSNASRGVGAGLTVFLQETAGTDWSYNNLAYWKDKGAEAIKPIMDEYYPEMNNIMELGQQTLGSVMGNFAGFTLDINDLAEIWDGFSYKRSIHQMSTALLRKPYWKDFFLDKCFPVTHEVETEKGFETQSLPNNAPSNRLMNGLLQYINKNKKWKWANLKNILIAPIGKQIKVAKRFVEINESEFTKTVIDTHFNLIKPILQYAEIWDSFEAKKRFSVRDWMFNENPSKRVFIIRPSTEYSEQLLGTTKGILNTIVGIINNPTFKEDSDLKVKRHFYIILDEFDSLGNIEYFIRPAIALFRSKAVTVVLACQDTNQMVHKYGKEITDFIISSIGNKLYIGVGMGATAELIAGSFGDMKINKMHISMTKQADGSSSSINYQEHDEKVVTPSILNSRLGTDIKKGITTYLYMPSGSNDVFLLETGFGNIKKYEASEPADWTLGIKLKPKAIENDKIKSEIFSQINNEEVPASPGELTDAKLPPPMPNWSAPAISEKMYLPKVDREDNDYDLDYEDLESEFHTIPIEMFKDYERIERQLIYTLPNEAVNLDGELVKDIAIEGVLSHSPLHMLKSYADVQDSATIKRTNSKSKFLRALKEIKDKDNELDIDTTY